MYKVSLVDRCFLVKCCLLHSAQIYFYDHKPGEFEFLSRPRQLMPYAVLRITLLPPQNAPAPILRSKPTVTPKPVQNRNTSTAAAVSPAAASAASASASRGPVQPLLSQPLVPLAVTADRVQYQGSPLPTRKPGFTDAEAAAAHATIRAPNLPPFRFPPRPQPEALPPAPLSQLFSASATPSAASAAAAGGMYYLSPFLLLWSYATTGVRPVAHWRAEESEQKRAE